jgi:hypothetical protein
VTATWWQSHPPAEIHLDCSGREHRIRWHDGVLTAPDHDDPAGERALAALGAERCPCIELLDAWARHDDDLRILTMASRGPADHIAPGTDTMSSRGRAALIPGRRPGATAPTYRSSPAAGAGFSVTQLSRSGAVASFGPAAGGSRPRRPWPGSALEETTLLLMLGGGLPDRLVTTILAVWSQRLAAGDRRAVDEVPALTAALYGRVVPCVRAWLGEPDLPVTVDMIDGSEPPGLVGDDDGIRARLPFAWLSDIWARGLAVVLGRFSLGLFESGDSRQRVLTVSTDLIDVRPVTISIDD